MIKPADGNAPSAPSVKLCSMVSCPDESSLKTVPQPTPLQLWEAPPKLVVPNRSPALSMIRGPVPGASPSTQFPTEQKAYSTVSTPSDDSLNTVPQPVPPHAELPPFTVVP